MHSIVYCFISSRYIHALYYMIMTCITAGVLSSDTYIDKIMLIFDCLILANGFAYLVNALGVIMAEMQLTQTELRKKLRQINHYLDSRNISKELKNKIKRHYQYIHKDQFDGTQKGDFIVDILSPNLFQDMQVEMYYNILKAYPIFKNYFSSEFVKKLTKYVKTASYTPGEIIFEFDGGNNNLYYTISGEVQLYIGDDKHDRIFKVVDEKNFFGELTFFTDSNRNYSARTVNACTIGYIQRDDFIMLLKEFKLDFEMFCLLRDRLIYNPKNYKIFENQCVSCFKYDHQIQNCYMVQFKKEAQNLMMKSHVLKQKNRNYYHRREKRTSNAKFHKQQMINAFQKHLQQKFTFEFDKQMTISDSSLSESDDGGHRQLELKKIVSSSSPKQQKVNHQIQSDVQKQQSKLQLVIEPVIDIISHEDIQAGQQSKQSNNANKSIEIENYHMDSFVEIKKEDSNHNQLINNKHDQKPQQNQNKNRLTVITDKNSKQKKKESYCQTPTLKKSSNNQTPAIKLARKKSLNIDDKQQKDQRNDINQHIRKMIQQNKKAIQKNLGQNILYDFKNSNMMLNLEGSRNLIQSIAKKYSPKKIDNSSDNAVQFKFQKSDEFEEQKQKQNEGVNYKRKSIEFLNQKSNELMNQKSNEMMLETICDDSSQKKINKNMQMIIYDKQHNYHIEKLKNYEIYCGNSNIDKVVFEYNFKNASKVKKNMFQKLGLNQKKMKLNNKQQSQMNQLSAFNQKNTKIINRQDHANVSRLSNFRINIFRQEKQNIHKIKILFKFQMIVKKVIQGIVQSKHKSEIRMIRNQLNRFNRAKKKRILGEELRVSRSLNYEDKDKFVYLSRSSRLNDKDIENIAFVQNYFLKRFQSLQKM